MNHAFLKTNVLYSLVHFEPYLFLAFLALSAWAFYRLVLQGVTQERHRNLRNHYRNLVNHFFVLSLLLTLFLGLQSRPSDWLWTERLLPYIALLTYGWGMYFFVKVARLWVLQYLFLQSMREGVPLLIVNVVSLLMTIALIFWSASRIFDLQLGPLLATSAAFSIILGLAMQDTLGNLFAGLSLQIDKSFEIGDWLEITLGVQKLTGQVKDITWRSVSLMGVSDEIITVPNRMIAQAQISNFSPPEQPIVRWQVFRVPHGAPIDKAKELIERSLTEIPEVRGLPAPLAYVQEATDSWVGIKAVYFIDSYSAQNAVGDRVLRKGLEVLRQHGIELANQEIRVKLNGSRHVQTDTEPG